VTPCSEQLGPARVWIKQGEGPGLAMARSIGDHMCSTVGVVATPEVLRFNLEPDVEYRVLMASDGVWELCALRRATPDAVLPPHRAHRAHRCAPCHRAA
jgi:serine/threonine protein phosphatase PrpC